MGNKENSGRYERTELSRSRFRLTIAERTERRLRMDLTDIRHEAARLSQRIAELEAAEGK